MWSIYRPKLNALVYQTVRKRKIQKTYFLYFKYKIHVLYFVTFSGTSILHFILIHLFDVHFVFCIRIHFDVFLPISVCTPSLSLSHHTPPSLPVPPSRCISLSVCVCACVCVCVRARVYLHPRLSLARSTES